MGKRLMSPLSGPLSYLTFGNDSARWHVELQLSHGPKVLLWERVAAPNHVRGRQRLQLTAPRFRPVVMSLSMVGLTAGISDASSDRQCIARRFAVCRASETSSYRRLSFQMP